MLLNAFWIVLLLSGLDKKELKFCKLYSTKEIQKLFFNIILNKVQQKQFIAFRVFFEIKELKIDY